MYLQIVLIISSLIIALIGWFKSEKSHRIWSFVVVVVLLGSAIVQSYITWENKQVEETKQSKIDSLLVSNNSLTNQNMDLYEQNTELLEQIKRYQGELISQKNAVDAIRDFAGMAELNPLGKKFLTGNTISYSTKISKIMDGAISVDDKKYEFKCTDAALRYYEQAIDEYPKFPFSYYALAFCLRQRQNPKWTEYAKKAQGILSKTTEIDGHHDTHDQALQKIETWLRQN